MCVSERCISPQCVLHPHFRQLLLRASPCPSQGVGMHSSHSTMGRWARVRVVLGWATTPAANPSRPCVWPCRAASGLLEGCGPRQLRAVLWGIVMNSSLTVQCVMSSLPDCDLQRHGWCGSLTHSVSGWEPQTGLWQTALSWWYCATTSDLFPLHAVAWFILP